MKWFFYIMSSVFNPSKIYIALTFLASVGYTCIHFSLFDITHLLSNAFYIFLTPYLYLTVYL